METAKRNAKVGLFMLFGLLIFVAGVLVISNMRKIFIRKVTAVAVFEDVNGLNKGNNVLFSGVKVGTVESLDFVPGKGVEVTFQIEEKSQEYIYKDAELSIGTDGLIGNPVLVIKGGNLQAGIIEDGHTFKVRKEDTQQDMLATLQQNNKNILSITEDLKGIVSSINSGEGNLGKLLKEENLYNQLDQTLAQLRSSSYQINSMSKDLSQFSHDLNDPQNMPYQLVHNQSVVPAISKTFVNLEEVTHSAKLAAGEARQLVSDTRGNIDAAFSSESSTLGVLLHDRELAESMKNSMLNLESGSEKLDENLEALQHSIFFRRYFRKKEKAKEAEEQTENIENGTTQK